MRVVHPRGPDELAENSLVAGVEEDVHGAGVGVPVAVLCGNQFRKTPG